MIRHPRYLFVRTVKLLAVLALLLVGTPRCEEGKRPRPEPPSPQLMLPGPAATTLRTPAGLYRQKCSDCHGRYGAGDGPGARLLTARPRDWTQKGSLSPFNDQELLEKILDGSQTEGNRPKPMPAYDGIILPEEAKALVQYIRKFEGTIIPERPR